MELWLDPQAGWMPRERNEYAFRRLRRKIEVVDYEKCSGLWYPRRATVKTYGPPSEGAAQVSTMVYNILRFEKKELAASDVEVDLSQAAYIVDLRTGNTMAPNSRGFSRH
jgi:hypothetical protein